MDSLGGRGQERSSSYLTANFERIFCSLAWF